MIKLKRGGRTCSEENSSKKLVFKREGTGIKIANHQWMSHGLVSKKCVSQKVLCQGLQNVQLLIGFVNHVSIGFHWT